MGNAATETTENSMPLGSQGVFPVVAAGAKGAGIRVHERGWKRLRLLARPMPSGANSALKYSSGNTTFSRVTQAEMTPYRPG